MGVGRPDRSPSRPGPANIADRFTRQARATPDRVALVSGDSSMTYAELDAGSSDLARALGEAGVAPGDPVGVCLERSPELIIALLAVLKAGAAYVPLDPAYPDSRLAFMVADTALRVVISDQPVALAGSGVAKVPSTVRPADPSRPLPPVPADSTAYVIYTSGSTGRPKGVLIPHRNVVALVDSCRGEFGLGTADVWTFFHSIAFDFSVWEIWGCLLTGGRLVVVPYWTSRDPDEFAALVGEHGVTVLNQTPSAFAHLLHILPGRPDLALRLVIFGGEPLDTRTLVGWFDQIPTTRCQMVNMYGITETTVHCTWHRVTEADALRGSRSVGRPLARWDLHVLDPDGHPVPPGTAGEIHVGGAGVSAGYLGRPALTAQRFIPDHLSSDAGRRLYRSGDRGRYLPNGELEHLGRLDDQVKVRGHRVEPGEIRAVLLEEPRVRAAAAVVRNPEDSAGARLDAYVVVAEPVAPGELRRWATERLPDYMVPATVTLLPSLPLTVNGKLDTARLPDPFRDAPASTPARWEGTGDQTVTRVAVIWQRVLGAPVRPDDNFFELGGNSLLAARLNTAMREAGFDGLALRDIFRNSTPRRLARVLETTGRRPTSGG